LGAKIATLAAICALGSVLAILAIPVMALISALF
jgi:hypothetical protein